VNAARVPPSGRGPDRSPPWRRTERSTTSPSSVALPQAGPYTITWEAPSGAVRVRVPERGQAHTSCGGCAPSTSTVLLELPPENVSV